MNNTTRAAAAVVIVFALAGAAEANGMRCGTHLIARGDHVSKLLRYCGEPDFAQSRSAHRSYRTRFGHIFYTGLFEEVRIDEWTYNLGPNKLMRVITMENGVVRDVKHLGYGYH